MIMTSKFQVKERELNNSKLVVKAHNVEVLVNLAKVVESYVR